MITLKKPNEKASISLSKGSNSEQFIKVSATWEGRGDLDLRAGILLPNGETHFIDCNNAGDINSMPYIKHLGDIVNANSGEEVILVNKDIAKHHGGAVHIIFSVYSAVTNGNVSIKQLKPKLAITGASDEVSCDFFCKGGADSCYTYTLAVISLEENKATIRADQQLSKSGSENTPWITLSKGEVKVDYTGNPVFKSGTRSKQVKSGKQGWLSRKLLGTKASLKSFSNL